jgi:hypothetical protein
MSIQNENFSEVQRFSNAWISLIVIGLAVLVAFLFVNQVIMSTPVGDYPLPDPFLWSLFFVFTVTLPLVMLNLKLVVTLRDDRVTVAFFPLFFRTIRYREIRRFETVKYDPAERGGHGVQWTPGLGWAFTANGLSGVLLTLENGKRVLVGSRDAGRLFSELRARMPEG